jgi:hypothetical protein
VSRRNIAQNGKRVNRVPRTRRYNSRPSPTNTWENFSAVIQRTPSPSVKQRRSLEDAEWPHWLLSGLLGTAHQPNGESCTTYAHHPKCHERFQACHYWCRQRGRQWEKNWTVWVIDTANDRTGRGGFYFSAGSTASLLPCQPCNCRYLLPALPSWTGWEIRPAPPALCFVLIFCPSNSPRASILHRLRSRVRARNQTRDQWAPR